MNTQQPQPSIGRIVHFTIRNNIKDLVAVPALIIALNDDGTVHLDVFLRSAPASIPGNASIISIPSAEFSEAAAGSEEAEGKWNWPRYVPLKGSA